MKNFFVRLASLLVMGSAVLVSCVRVQDVEDPTESLSAQMTIVASLDGTRTANDGNATVWVEGDLISALHCDAENPTSYRLEKFTNVNPNEFKGNVHNLSAVNNWYIMYPYSTDFESADAAPISIVDQVQNGNDNRAHMAGEAFPLYGRNFNVDKADAVTINMQNILAVFRASVTNKSAQPIIVKRVVVTTPKAVSGQFTGDLTQTPVVWTPGEQTSNSITLEVQNGTALAVNAETYFYVGLMPFTLEAGSELKIQVVAVHPNAPETEISYYITRSWADPVSWNSGRIQGVGINFDENHQTDPGDPSGPDDPQPEKTPRNLEFAETQLVWTLGEGYETGSVYDLPTLNGVTEGVTYSSTNENVAVIVNGNQVRLVADGLTTIKASALATDTYEAGEASLSLQVLPAQTPSTTTAYTKANQLTVGGTYVITDVDDARLFKGATDGSYVSVNPVNGVINDPQNTLAGYEFTVTQSGSKYCLVFNDGKYLVDDYQANSTTGLVYESSMPTDTRYLYSVTVNNGVFFFSTDQRNSTNTGEVLYYKPQSMGGTGANTFKIGGSGREIGVHLYLKTSAGQTQQTQTISFAQPSVTWTLGSTYAIGGSYDMPALSGAKTEVSYTSDNEGVARYSNGKIEIMGVGTAHITATAAETAAWTGATARLTVTIQNPADPTGNVYKRVEASEVTSGYDWSGTYLFVDETSGKAFAAFSNVTNYAVNVTINNGQIVASDAVNRYALTVTDAGVQHANASGQEAYDVRNADGKYIFYSSSTIQIADSHHRNNYDYYHAFQYQNGGVQVLSSGNSSGFNKYYLGYESSAFGYLQNGDSRRVQLYKLSNGVTPTPDDPTPSTGTTYTKVNTLTVGGTYLITSVADDQLFNGSIVNNNNHVAISPVGGVISDASNAYSAYEFTVEQSNGRYYLKFNDGKYLVCDYANGDGTTGLCYVDAQSKVTYPYALTVNNGAFEFSTTQMNSTTSTNQVLYYKTANMTGSGQNSFKIGGSGPGIGVHLYLKGSGGGSTPTPDDPTPTTGTTYTKANSLTVGGTYLVMDVSDTRLFTAATNGSYDTISPVNGVITDANGSYAGYEFTVTQSGSKLCLMHNNQYLIDDYSTSGNSTTGLVYESTKPADTYLYTCTVTNGVFFFTTKQRNGSNNQDEYLYYKPQSAGGTGADTFKLGGSGSSYGVHLYLKNGSSSTKPLQNLSFAQSTVTLPLETATGTYSVQTVSGNAGAVTYTSSNPSVATVNGTTITVTGFGETRISANAAETSTYAATSLYYTLVVSRTSQEGVWNLENDAVNQYLTAAMSSYPNSSSSVVGTYARNVSASNRLDWPNPVTVSWPTAITGTKYVVIYSDAAHASRVDYVGVTKSTSSSALVYNLIPGKTYYYGVVVGNSEVASGTFSTEGRRRMMKVGDDYGQNFANNCRDFGGQVTTDGRHIKYGKIFRGTNMDGCEPKAGQSVNAGFGKSSGALGDSAKVTLLNYMKIELDVDLRGSGNTLGSNLNSALGFSDITVGDANTYVGHTKETYAGTSELTDSNKQYNGKTRMGVTLTRIMNAAVNGKNVYIHCMVGADRTGFTCLMLESVLGVSQAYCDMDYEMTSFSGVGSRTRGNSSYVNHYSSGINAINSRQVSSGTFQDKAIDYIVNVHGVDRNLITRFQNAMLE